MQIQINLSPRHAQRRAAVLSDPGLTSLDALRLGATAGVIVVAVIGSFWVAAMLHTDDGAVLQFVVGLATALAVLTHPSAFKDQWIWSVRGVFVGKAAFFVLILASAFLAGTGVYRFKLRSDDIARCRTALLAADNVHQRAA